jgi:hypothetical protein
MACEEITELLGGWPGFRLVGVVREPGTAKRSAPRIALIREAVPGQDRRCSRCGEAVADVHSVTPRKVRDLPILEAETWLVGPLPPLELLLRVGPQGGPGSSAT